MSYPLAGLLPVGAAELYQRLLVAGRFLIAEHREVAASTEMRALIDAGFARERHVGEPVIVPVEPSHAVEQALLAAQRRMLEEQRQLLRAREQMELLQRRYLTGSDLGDRGAPVEVLTDPAEIGALSVELCISAHRDVSNLETEHFSRPPDARSAKLPPAEVLARGVRFRNIYSRPVLDLPAAPELVRLCSAGGWELRVLPTLPMKMVLVDDRAALLPLDPTGVRGAMVVRAPVVVAALRMYFEMLWNRATPIGDAPPGKLSAVQARVLQLMVAGVTDAAIGRQLGISERTVRRHISTVLDLLGVDNRISAAAVAVREGWID